MPKDIKKVEGTEAEPVVVSGETAGTEYPEGKTAAKTILVFSAELQKETPHTVDIDGNGEIVLTDTLTGRFLKFPKGTTAAELKEGIAKHKFQNEGQVTVEYLEKEKAKLINELLDEES